MNDKLKVLSLFSGIGAFEKAAKNIGLEYELINFSEIYKPGIQAYCKIHNELESKNLGDITKVDPSTLEDFDLMTYGFPCQSFSMMGHRSGFNDVERGGLFFISMEIVKKKMPKYLIAENVQGLLSIDNGNTFKTILNVLSKLGYNNYYKLLDSSDFGIPQTRKRIFIISIRKDIKQRFGFRLHRRTYKVVNDIIDHTVTTRHLNKNLIKYCDEKYMEYNNTMLPLFSGYNNGHFKSGYTVNNIYSIYRIAPTLLTSYYQPTFFEIHGVLIGKERLRLQGFDDDDYNKIKSIVSESEIAYLTGNSITVNVLEYILKNLCDTEYLNNRLEFLSDWE